MFDFDRGPVAVQYSELAEEAVELVSHLRIVSRPETRELLDRHTDDTFRCHEIDASNPRAVVGQLSTAYLIEPAEIETGPYVDWTATDRAAEIIDIADEYGVYITRSESDAVLQVGAKLFQLCGPDVWWTTADAPASLHPRELSTLSEAGLLERAVETGDGYSTVWRTNERMYDIATVVWEVVTDD